MRGLPVVLVVVASIGLCKGAAHQNEEGPATREVEFEAPIPEPLPPFVERKKREDAEPAKQESTPPTRPTGILSLLRRNNSQAVEPLKQVTSLPLFSPIIQALFGRKKREVAETVKQVELAPPHIGIPPLPPPISERNRREAAEPVKEVELEPPIPQPPPPFLERKKREDAEPAKQVKSTTPNPITGMLSLLGGNNSEASGPIKQVMSLPPFSMLESFTGRKKREAAEPVKQIIKNGESEVELVPPFGIPPQPLPRFERNRREAAEPVKEVELEPPIPQPPPPFLERKKREDAEPAEQVQSTPTNPFTGVINLIGRNNSETAEPVNQEFRPHIGIPRFSPTISGS